MADPPRYDPTEANDVAGIAPLTLPKRSVEAPLTFLKVLAFAEYQFNWAHKNYFLFHRNIEPVRYSLSKIAHETNGGANRSDESRDDDDINLTALPAQRGLTIDERECLLEFFAETRKRFRVEQLPDIRISEVIKRLQECVPTSAVEPYGEPLHQPEATSTNYDSISEFKDEVARLLKTSGYKGLERKPGGLNFIPGRGATTEGRKTDERVDVGRFVDAGKFVQLLKLALIYHIEFRLALDSLCEAVKSLYEIVETAQKERLERRQLTAFVLKTIERVREFSDIVVQDILDSPQPSLRVLNLKKGALETEREKQNKFIRPEPSQEPPSLSSEHFPPIEAPHAQAVVENEFARVKDWIRTEATSRHLKTIAVLIRQRRQELSATHNEDPEPSKSYYQKLIRGHLYWYERYYDPQLHRQRDIYVGKDLPVEIQQSTDITITPFRSPSK